MHARVDRKLPKVYRSATLERNGPAPRFGQYLWTTLDQSNPASIVETISAWWLACEYCPSHEHGGSCSGPRFNSHITLRGTISQLIRKTEPRLWVCRPSNRMAVRRRTELKFCPAGSRKLRKKPGDPVISKQERTQPRTFRPHRVQIVILKCL